MADVETPRTEAGRALYDRVRIHNVAQRVRADDKHDAAWLDPILAIEAEAAALAVAQVPKPSCDFDCDACREDEDDDTKAVAAHSGRNVPPSRRSG